jgi:hypothetical protein
MAWLVYDLDVHECPDDCICEECDPDFNEDDLYADEALF